MRLSSREAILLYIRDRKEVTVSELSRKFQLTPADIRYHLKKLQADGAVTLTSPEPWKKRTRGRPEMVIQLAHRSRPNSLPQLAHALLSAIAEIQDTERSSALFASVRQHLISEEPAEKGLTHRINRLVSALNQLQYQTRWEAHVSGPRILFANCPYAQLVAGHPELCEMDQNLIEEHLGLPVECLERFNPSAHHGTCVFQVILQPSLPAALLPVESPPDK